MSVNFDFNFWTVLLFAMNFGLAFFVALSNRNKAANDELKAMKEALQKDIKQSRDSVTARIEKHGERLSRIEADIENSVGNEDLIAVHRRVDQILASSNKMEGQLGMVISNLKEIHSFILAGNNHGR